MMAVYVAVAGVGAAGIGYVLYRCYDAYYGSGAQTSVGGGSSGWSDTENVWKKGALAIDSTAAGLERDVCAVWERSWTTLPVCVDLPRLARKMTLVRTTASGGSEVVVDGPAYDVSSDHAKHTLMHDIVCDNCHHHTAVALAHAGRPQKGCGGLLGAWLICCLRGRCTWWHCLYCDK